MVRDRLITAGSDLLKANTDYAVLGATCTVLAGALGIRSADFGNVRIAIPASPLQPDMCANYFPYLSDSIGMPAIPVFNSGNKGNIIVDAFQDENTTVVPFSLILAELDGLTEGK